MMKKDRHGFTIGVGFAITFFFAVFIFIPSSTYATYIIDSIKLEHRVYENPAYNHDRLAFDVIDQETGKPPQENVVAGVYVKNNGTDVPGQRSASFSISKELSFDEGTGNWTEESNAYAYNRYSFNQPLTSGTYDTSIEFKSAELQNYSLYFPEYQDLPFVSSSSFDLCINKSGDLLWSWDLPEILPDNSNLLAYISNYEAGKDIYWYLPASFENIIVSKDYFSFIGSTNLNFGVSLRQDQGRNRSYSNTLYIANISDLPTAPVPEPSTIVLMGLGLVGLAGFGRKRFRK